MLTRTELTEESIRFETPGKRAAAIVGLHTNSKSLLWSARKTTLGEKVDLFRPFLNSATEAWVAITNEEGPDEISRRDIEASRQKLDRILELGSAVTHFSLEIFSPETGEVTLRHNFVEPDSPLVSVRGTVIQPEFIEELFHDSATAPLRPHFDEIVADFRQHVVTNKET